MFAKSGQGRPQAALRELGAAKTAVFYAKMDDAPLPTAAAAASAESASAISDADLAACLRVLCALCPDGAMVAPEYQCARLKPLRCAPI
jgi:hypothetical protein